MSLRYIYVNVGAALLGMAAALDDAPSCFTAGSAYNDTDFTHPNGGFPASALACQTLCQQQSLTCTHFTFYNNTKGCWLQGGNMTVFPELNATSGPGKCPEGGEFTEVAKETATESDAGAEVERDTGKKIESGGFPLWVLIVVAIVLLGLCGAGAFYYFNQGDSSDKKDKKKKNKSQKAGSGSQDAAPSGDPESQTPLIGSQTAPPPQFTLTGPAMVPSVTSPMSMIQPGGAQYSISGAAPAQYIVSGGTASVAPAAQYTISGAAPAQYTISGGVPAQYTISGGVPAQYTVTGAP